MKPEKKQLPNGNYSVGGVSVNKMVNGKWLVAPGTVHEITKRTLPPALKHADTLARTL